MSESSWIPPVELDPVAMGTDSEEGRDTVGAEPGVVANAVDPTFNSILQSNEFRKLADGILKFSEGEVQILAVKRQIKQQIISPTWKWIFLTILGLATIVIIQGTFRFLAGQFDVHFLFGFVSTILVGFIAFTIGVTVRDQFRALRRLKNISRLQESTRPFIGADTHGHVGQDIALIADLYADRAEVRKDLEVFHESCDDCHTDGEVLTLFSQQVLRPIDERAYAVVAERAADTAIFTAVSPLAFLDALVSLWRNALLVRQIGTLYGARPGFAGMARLLRHTLENLAVAGTASLVSEAAAETVGGNLSAIVSAQVGQGIANGLMTARVGLIAMRLCRPINFTEEEKPRFARIRQEILSRVKNTVSRSG